MMNKYNVGSIVTGKVTGIENYGIFISLDDGATGLIHISEISNSFVRNINDYAEIDEEIKAKIIGVEDDGRHLKLSVKDLDYRKNSKLTSKIKETKSGFSSLGRYLDDWIEEKYGKIAKK